MITAINHGFVSGDKVTVANVRGTTNANTNASTPNWIISVIDANSFTLQGSTDSSKYLNGPGASGKSVGRSMGKASPFQRMTLLSTSSFPTLFVSQGSRLQTSVDGGVNFTAVGGTPWPKDNLAISTIAAPTQFNYGWALRNKLRQKHFFPAGCFSAAGPSKPGLARLRTSSTTWARPAQFPASP